MKKLLTALLIFISFQAAQAQEKADTIKMQADSARNIIDSYPHVHQPLTSINQPLIILNGKHLTYDSLSLINPNKIESIEVLKGANAEEVYGEEGKRGVVIITLKEAKRK